MQFVCGAGREALLQRLAATSPQELPSAVGEVALSREDAKGEQYTQTKPSTQMVHCVATGCKLFLLSFSITPGAVGMVQ